MQKYNARLTPLTMVTSMVIAGLLAAGNTVATEMPETARKLMCIACHSVDKKLVGPAWIDVAKKYRGAASYTYNGEEYPLLEGLMLKVSQGGKGVWGEIQMPAFKKAQQEEIRELVTFILGLGSGAKVFNGTGSSSLGSKSNYTNGTVGDDPKVAGGSFKP